MNAKCVASRSYLTLGLAAFVLSALLPSLASAVMITGSTYSKDTSDPYFNNATLGQANSSPQTKSYSITSATTISDSISSDTRYVHAQAWSSATVAPSGVTKVVGGRGWLDTATIAANGAAIGGPNFYNGRTPIWSSAATGTLLQVNSSSSTAAQFNLIVPAAIPAGLNPFLNNPLPGPAQSTTALAPGNGFGMLSSGAAGGTIPSFFDVFVTLDVDISQVGMPDRKLSGNLTYDPNTGEMTPGNDPGDIFTTSVIAQLSAGNMDVLLAGGINVQPNVPFDASISLTESMGDPNNPMSFIPDPSFTAAPIGAGGMFPVQLNLTDTADYSLVALPTPEPSTLILAGMGGAALLIAGRRKRSARQLPTGSPR